MKDLVRLKDVPELIGISRNTFLRHIRPKLTEYHIGRAVFFSLTELEDLALYSAENRSAPQRS